MIIKIHDEQVRVNGIDPIIESIVSSMVADYQDTEEQLYLLLSYYEDTPVSVTARKGEVVWKDRVDVYINTNSKKRLAEAVVKKVRHCFDPSMKRSENAEDAAIIKETAKAWLETIPDSDIVPPSLYPGRVFDRAMLALGARREEGVMTPPRYDFPPEGVTIDGVFISDEQLATIVERVGKWVKKQEQPLTAQPGDEEQPSTAQPGEQSSRKRGRQKRPFSSCLLGDNKDEKLRKIHSLIDGKIGKDAALIISCCIMKGWITKPTFPQVQEEFGNIGSKQGYNSYLFESIIGAENNHFTESEIEGTLAALD